MADGSGIKKDQWSTIATNFNKSAMSQSTEYPNLPLLLKAFSKQQLQSQLASLKSRFTAFEALKNNVNSSGFGWDEVHQIPTACPQVWADYIRQNPSAKEFRNQTMPYYEDLCTIFGGRLATGKHAFSPTSAAVTKKRVLDDEDDNSSVDSREHDVLLTNSRPALADLTNVLGSSSRAAPAVTVHAAAHSTAPLPTPPTGSSSSNSSGTTNKKVEMRRVRQKKADPKEKITVSVCYTQMSSFVIALSLIVSLCVHHQGTSLQACGQAKYRP